MNLNRGSVYWINLDPTQGSEIRKTRPCVIISASPINEARRTVIIIPLSTAAKPRPPIAVEVFCMDRSVTAVCDQIRAVDKTRLIERVDTLSKEDMLKIEEGLRLVLCL